MTTEATDAAVIPSASYMRTLTKEQALHAKSVIDSFFSNGPRPPSASLPVVVRIEPPKQAYWAFAFGAGFMIASILLLIFRKSLPPSLPGLPLSRYLALGGAIVLALGWLYWKRGGTRVIVPSPPRVDRIGAQAVDLIRKQIEQVGSHAEAAFGPPQAHVQRFLLQGVGRSTWNDNHEVSIVELTADRIYASALHLVAIELTPTVLSVRQYGLHLPTGTVCEQWATSRPISDVLGAARKEAHEIAAGAWDRAEKVGKDLTDLRKRNARPTVKITEMIKQREDELSLLVFDLPTSEEFEIDFRGGERVALKVAHKEYSKNPEHAANPIGGSENLANAVKAWEAINTARSNAETAQRKQRDALSNSAVGTHAGVLSVNNGIGHVHQGLAGFQESLLASIAGLQLGLNALNSGMTRQFTGTRETPPASAPSLAPILNGHADKGALQIAETRAPNIDAPATHPV